MKKFILGITLFIIGTLGILFLLYGSLEYPHSFIIDARQYTGLIGFLRGNGLSGLFILFLLFALSGLTISILCSFTKVFKD